MEPLPHLLSFVARLIISINLPILKVLHSHIQISGWLTMVLDQHLLFSFIKTQPLNPRIHFWEMDIVVVFSHPFPFTTLYKQGEENLFCVYILNFVVLKLPVWAFFGFSASVCTCYFILNFL